MRRIPRISSALLAGAAASALLVTGCGSSSPDASGSSGSATSSTSGGKPTQAQARQDLVRFSGCMRSAGVSNFPDPSDPQAVKVALSPKGGEAQSPTFRSAYAICRHLLPNGGQPQESTAQRQAHVVALLAFARCMRAHGFHSFPDPTSSGQISHEMLASAGVDIHQPAASQVADTCTSVTHGALTKADVAHFVAGQ